MSEREGGPLYGVTKDTAVLTITVILALLLLVDTGAIFRLEQLIAGQDQQNRSISALALQGVQSHNALCTLRDSELKQIAQARAILHTSHRQLVIKYGTGIADVPRQVFRQTIEREQAAVDALRLTNC